MSKPFLFGVGMGLALFVVVSVGASRLHQKNVKDGRRRADLLRYQADLVDATPVLVGELTKNELIHSRLFNKFYEKQTNMKISQVIDARAKSSETGDRILGLDLYVGAEEIITKTETPENYFGKLAQESDVVVRGQAIKKVSHITHDDAFLFTDYDFVVTEILKNNIGVPLAAGAKIIVTRPGGKVLVDGVIVKAMNHYFLPLPVGDHDLVLFLKLIQETGAYQSTNDTGSFELDGNVLRPLSAGQYPPGVLIDGSSFLKTARAVAKN
jgi:hypothetical protein